MMEKDYKILIADDEPDVLAIMAKHVSAQGYQVLTARDGEEAWLKIKTHIPQVILLDLSMPKLNGYEVLKNLREHPPTEEWQPVIIVSAKGELSDMQKGFSLEADHYLTKPCPMEDILKAIKSMIALMPQRISPKELQKEGERR